MIFRLGITERARNASDWNGDSTSEPSACTAATTALLAAITSARGRSERRPATGSGSSATTVLPVDDDEPAADLGGALDRAQHLGVAHPHDDEVVRVVGERRRERAAREPEAAHEAEPDPTGREMTLDDGDLGQVALEIGAGHAAVARQLLDQRIGHDLARDEPDHPCRAAAPRNAQILQRDRLQPHRLAHPLRHRGLGDLVDRSPALEHEPRHEALEIRAGARRSAW